MMREGRKGRKETQSRAEKKTYVVAGQDAVEELQGADGDEEGHEGVEQPGPLRRRVEVVRQHVVHDAVPRRRNAAPVPDARTGGGLAECRGG